MVADNKSEESLPPVILEAKRKLDLIASKPPKSVTKELLIDDNAVIIRVAVLRGVILTRTRELADVSIQSLENRHPTAAATLVRATVESIALLYDLKLSVGRVASEQSDETVSEMDRMVRTALWGRRYNVDIFKATNITTRLQRMAKEVPAIWSIYENLSEVAHPNADGLTGLYLTLNERSGDLEFRSDQQWRVLLTAAHNLSTTLDAVIIFDNELRSYVQAIDARNQN